MEIRSVESSLACYAGTRERTRRVVACIPDDRMEWRPGPGRFGFGDLVRHLAAFERYLFAENAAGRPSRHPGHGAELAGSAAEVRRFSETTHAKTLAILRGLTDDDPGRRCRTPAGAEIALRTWLRAMVEHEVHHRGRLFPMLDPIGAPTPPVFGLAAEEVRERSAPPPA